MVPRSRAWADSRGRPRALLALAVAVVGFVATWAGCRAREEHDAGSTPDVAVIVHSYSGTTAIVGRAIASMFRAPFLRYSDPPVEAPSTRENPLPVADANVVGFLGSARHLYLGFPIWAGGPPAATFALVNRLDLSGVRVSLVYTYLHHVDPSRIEALRADVAAAGGIPDGEIALRFPLTATDAIKAASAQQAVLANEKLWHTDEQPVIDCGAVAPRGGQALCRVTAGPVWVGDPLANTHPTRLRVGPFFIGRAEVTQREYGECVRDGGCVPVELGQSSCAFLGEDETLPMPCVTYDQAESFCDWAGLRLPTEAEWTRAARGGSNAAFPWGARPPGAPGEPRGNFGERPGEGIDEYELVPADSPWQTDGVAGLAPGCGFPAGNSPFGVCDLAGNLFEWVEPSGAARPEEGRAILKGGSWMDGEPDVFRVGARATYYRDHSFYLVGFRCAGDSAR